MTIATFQQPNFTTDSAAQYKAKIDASIAVVSRPGAAFAAHEQSTPNMTVRVAGGSVLAGGSFAEIAAQSTGTITAPSVNPRIDRVVIDSATGAVSVVTGAEAASPTPPAVPPGKFPVARVALSVGQSSITNANITDERLGVGGGVTELGLQQLVSLAASDSGTADAMVVAPVPAWTAYASGMTVLVKKGSSANATTSPTLNVSGLGAKPLYTRDGTALDVGALAANIQMLVVYDSALNGGSGGFRCMGVGAAPSNGEYRATIIYTAVGANTWTKQAGLKRVKASVFGGGGGSGGVASDVGVTSYSGPGGPGGWSEKTIEAASLAASETVTVGAGGTAGAATPSNGGAGGTSSFGAHCSATGGSGGTASSGVDRRTFVGTAGIGAGGDLNGRGFRVADGSGYGSGSFFGPTPSGAGDVPASGGATRSYTNAGWAVGYAGAAGIVIVEEFY